MGTTRKEYQILYVIMIAFIIWGPIHAQNVEKIAIMPLPGIRNDHGTKLAIENHLIDLLVDLKRFEIVERAQLHNILKEQKLSLSGVISDKDAVRVGNILGVDYLILGSVSEASIITTDVESGKYYKGKVSANIRIVSTETASILGSITESDMSHGKFNAGEEHSGEHLYAKAAENLVMETIKPKLYNLFPLHGYIIQILEEKKNELKALIDIGSEKGIKKKDKFVVFRKSADIKHPVTGEMIPGRIEELGEAEVQSVDIATAEVKIKTKKPIQIGDRIRSKEKKKSFWQKL